MELISNAFIIFFFLAVGALCVAGFKGTLLHGGVGLFELIGMLWRGEIKSKH